MGGALHLRGQGRKPPWPAPSTQSKVTPRRMFSHLRLGTTDRKTLLSLSLSFPMRKKFKWWCSNPRTWEVEARGSGVQSQSGYLRPCLKKLGGKKKSKNESVTSLTRTGLATASVPAQKGLRLSRHPTTNTSEAGLGPSSENLAFRRRSDRSVMTPSDSQ